MLSPISADLTVDRIVVNKSKREMWLLRESKTIRRYTISLGQSPVGPKECEGDSKTPEGLYTISGRNAVSKYHLSLRISYPNAARPYHGPERCRRESPASTAADAASRLRPGISMGTARLYSSYPTPCSNTRSRSSN